MRRLLFWLAIAVFGGTLPAAAETLNLANCTDRRITVETFNAEDTICIAFREKKDVSNCGVASFTCVGKCKVKVLSSPLDFICGFNEPEEGDQMYNTEGWLHDTDAMLQTYIDTYNSLCDCSQSLMKEVLGR